MTPQRKRVVVTGIGAVTAVGETAQETWNGLLEGRSGVRSGSTLFDTSDYPVQISAEVGSFEPRRFMDFKEARRMSRFSQFAVVAAREALVNSHLLPDEAEAGTQIDGVESSRAGTIIGTCVGGFVEVRNGTQVFLEKGYRRVGPMFIPRMLHNAAAANVSHQFGLRGHNSTTTTACAAGAQAIGDAIEAIRHGRADVMVAGGTEAPICDVGLAAFWSTGAMSTSRDGSPETASRPFDLNRDGLVIGEGAACLVLERLEHALARSAPIFAEVSGFGSSGDAYHLTAPEPSGSGEVRAMRWALEDADLTVNDVDYISAHATSTPIGDAIETLAIKSLFGEAAYGIPVSAAKSMIGHTIGAAGAIEAVSSIMTIVDGKIHPTTNYDRPDPECDLDYVPNEARQADTSVVLSNSLGMGGQNASLVFSRY
ncbi:MAG: beta-ketoacyl-ACP synthase II [Chloroflexota bacterium]|nr:MAG: beta-ketoacyl-ACP synthase II [Chloroflexota bacterium]